jgi:hypothetical protein
LFIACPFPRLALYTPGDVFGFSLNTVLVHELLLRLFRAGSDFAAFTLFRWRSLSDGGSSSADELENQRDHGKHQQNVNESTHGVAADYA